MFARHFATFKPKAVNLIPECAIPLPIATHLLRSLNIGYPTRKVALNVQCNPNDPSVRDLRGIVVLPHGFMKTKTLVIAEPELASTVKDADIIGGEELIPKIMDNSLEFDRVICSKKMLPKLAPLARILGPRGIMPTEKKGTVTNDIQEALKRQADAIVFKADVNGYLSSVVGVVGMKNEELANNIMAFIDKMNEVKKGKTKFIQRMSLKAEQDASLEIMFNK